MLGLRRGGRVSCRCSFIRANSTLQPQAPATEAPVPPSANAEGAAAEGDTDKQAVTKVWKTRRPNISLARPREWNRPVIKGVLPAFDEALRVIQKDSEAIKREVEQYKKRLEDARQASEPDAVSIKQLEDKLHILEVQSEVNLPDVRWKFRNGLGVYLEVDYLRLLIFTAR